MVQEEGRNGQRDGLFIQGPTNYKVYEKTESERSMDQDGTT